MDGVDAFPGLDKPVPCELDPESKFARFAAFFFPIIDGLDRSLPLYASGEALVDERFGESLGMALRINRCPADEESLFAFARLGILEVGRDVAIIA